ncbi:myb/SANT-like DNA-binding domain-containing protein 4 [Lytechinus pictus]|uniref:myb/SANT-like DNA-binding domain-containing protein 4 n=1 Tax=Lytechinus pictus TaxID=7653 RepID=UPI0030BA2979
MDKHRNKNFSIEEVMVLVSEVVARKEIIVGAISSTITNAMKTRVWDCISEKVSKVEGRRRSADEVRKKFSVEKSKVKKKAAEIKRSSRATGGGPALPPLSEWEEVLRDFIGEEGISGCASDALETPVNSTNSTATITPAVEIESEKDALLTLASMANGCQKIAVDVSDDVTQLDTPQSRRKRRRSSDEFADVWDRWLRLEEERITVEKERLEVEKERLRLEQRRFDREDEIIRSQRESQSSFVDLR